MGYAHGKGTYNFLPGPGTAPKLSGHLGATTLETTGKAKISCSSGSSVGEYTGAKTLTMTLTLGGCERASNHQACQSVGGASGQIVTNALEGTLGFINIAKPSVGLDLAREPALASFECTAPGLPGKELLTVEGSVIGQIGKIDEMVSGFTITFTGRAGRQIPEAFEGGPTDTLLTSTVGGAAEPSALTSALTVSDEEPLEVKAKTR
jgi:hypothetical protein